MGRIDESRAACRELFRALGRRARQVNCQSCGSREAVHHSVTIGSGKKVEKHLCESCFREESTSLEKSIADMARKAKCECCGASPAGVDLGTGPEWLRMPTLCLKCAMRYRSLLMPELEKAQKGGEDIGQVVERVKRGLLGRG